MSATTDIVRSYVDAKEFSDAMMLVIDAKADKLRTALLATITAAERFEALELAHNPSKKGETILIRYWDDEARTWKVCSSSLAELADKLRKTK